MNLPTPRTEAGATGLRALRRTLGAALVGLDFDGTLAPIVADPEQARIHPRALAALRRLVPGIGAVVIVTGRPATQAVRYGKLADLASLGTVTVLGHYGMERWESGRTSAPEPPPGVARVRAELPGLLASTGVTEGTHIEDKGASLAVHTRQAADPEDAFELLRGPLAALAERAGLVLEPGRRVLELRPPGMDKGAALVSYARERDARAVLFAGDDLGDLAAFDGVARLRASGVPGITVCSGSVEVTELAGRADLVVDGPVGVADLLDALAEALGA